MPCWPINLAWSGTDRGLCMVSRTQSACANGVDQVLLDNEHHLLLECKHSALVEIISGHRALFEGITDVMELMAAVYKPELATILGRCMHDILYY